MDNKYGEAVGCCRQCKYFLEPSLGSPWCCLLQDTTDGDSDSCKFAQQKQPMCGFCKRPGEEMKSTFNQYKAGRCENCEHKRVCRFTAYFQCMYGPFNCAGENITA